MTGIKGFSGFAGLESKNFAYFQNDKATRGKYINQSIGWLYSHKPDYLVWVYENLENHGLTPGQYKTALLCVEQEQEEAEDSRRELGAESQGFFNGRFKK